MPVSGRLRVLMMLDLELADLLCVSLAFLPQLLIIHGDFLLVCRRQVGHFRFGVPGYSVKHKTTNEKK